MLNVRLRELREAKGLSNKAIAIDFSIHETTYGKYELGHRKPDIEMLQKFADYFDCSVDYLIGRTDNPAPSDSSTPAPIKVQEQNVIDLNELSPIAKTIVENVVDMDRNVKDLPHGYGGLQPT